MNTFTQPDLKKLHIPTPESHKGQNGRLLIIGGSHLFHSASVWSLTVASRIVDLVHYSSVPENNEMIQKAKEHFRNGIVVPRGEVDAYVDEDDVILIGPGMVRTQLSNYPIIPASPAGRQLSNIKEIEKIKDEGVQTAALTNYLLKKHPHKQWVIDAGALQMMDVNLVPKNAILTPHHGEFRRFVNEHVNSASAVADFAKKHHCIVFLKGEVDMVSDGKEIFEIKGGNAGMTKGGTGDVLAGLVAALACRNDPLLAACAASLINKAAGDDLYTQVGPYFNASDLADKIPTTMKRLLL